MTDFTSRALEELAAARMAVDEQVGPLLAELERIDAATIALTGAVPSVVGRQLEPADLVDDDRPPAPVDPPRIDGAAAPRRRGNVTPERVLAALSEDWGGSRLIWEQVGCHRTALKPSLDRLLADGRIEKRGNGRATEYRLAGAERTVSAEHDPSGQTASGGAVEQRRSSPSGVRSRKPPVGPDDAGLISRASTDGSLSTAPCSATSATLTSRPVPGCAP